MKKIRESKISKFLVYYFSIMIVSQVVAPTRAYALTSGPTQPEFNAFTPIGTSDMVDLTSGDYNYNIPIMDVGGYPINMAYNSGVSMDQESSWVGLGWNLSAGQIQRQLRGLPDDFNSKDGAIDATNYDYIHYKNDLKDNITAGVNVGVSFPIFGVHALSGNASLNIQYNNYLGITFKPTAGISAAAGQDEGVSGSVGLSFTGSASEGASITPRIGIGFTKDKHVGDEVQRTKNSVGLSLGFNTRKGVENIGMSYSVNRSKACADDYSKLKENKLKFEDVDFGNGGTGISGSLSFNNISFTPASKIGYYNNNFSFNAALGSEIMGPEIQMQLTGYGSFQKIADKYRNYQEPAFGYDNTHNKKNNGVLDFNRENEVSVNAKTNILHTPVFTYDTYSIQGQGISGMFRPYKSKVTYLNNDKVVTSGNGLAVGIELGFGNLVHTGIDVKANPSYSYTSGWNNNNKTLAYLKDSGKGNFSYENVTYKLVNSGNVDPLQSLYINEFREKDALTFKIGGSRFGRTLESEYLNHGSLQTIDRNERFKRTKLIIKVSKKEALGDPMFTPSIHGKNHHTAGMKILNEDGSLYVYGDAVYNTQKLEETYDVSGSTTGDLRTGLVDSGINSLPKSDKFYNSVGTPAYAHSYLLTSILSSDYEDIDQNGPSNNDLGGFTLFKYSTPNSNFNWRIPYDKTKATYNQVLNTKTINKRGNVISGVKELKYLDKIITKTHVAFFDIDDRLDALSSMSSGNTRTAQKYLKSIRLYSLPEVTNAAGEIFDPVLNGNNTIKPIKTAFFEYDYLLCPGTPNSTGPGAGKLTLKKLYFTYRNSNMGKYTPYQFEYSDINPKYDPKGFDIWGNYKYNNSSNTGKVTDALPNATEFPYALQNSSNILGENNFKLWNTTTDNWDGASTPNAKDLADQYASAWTLSKVILPSGGQIEIDIESDDYAYVQNKKAMQLFDVVGAGNSNDVNLNDASRYNLYSGNTHKQFLWIKLANEANGFSTSDFISKYLSENLKEFIQFKFLLNMTGNSSDYVGGYLKLGSEQQIKITQTNGATYVALPMEMRDREKGGGGSTNPISKTGWGFARQNLNKEVFTLGGDSTSDNLKSIINDLLSSFGSIYELLAGVNGVLESKNCARTFKPNKAWVRLENPDGHKLGGGLRVKSIRLSDNWKSIMNGNSGTSFDMEYGQVYDYNLENGMSSGVASYEPNGSAENALVQPFFYDSNEYNTPAENNFVEKPFGENFFPSARITYSRISVKSLDRKDSQNITIVNKHATGKVITESYTTKDFPTKVNFTPMQKETDNPSIANQALGVIQGYLPYYSQKKHITATQGFSVVTNDMDGKTKSESILDQNNVLISKVEYKYNQKVVNGISLNELDSSLDVIDREGNISKKLIGLDYDMYHDFQENYSENESIGFDGNLGVVLYGIFPAFVPIPLPKYSRFENKLNTSVTMKHVNQAGILIEKTAYDLGSTVKTKHLAWDADTAQVLLTETQNEYNDRYYSLNYPAYWMYENMGLASNNIGIESKLERISSTYDNNNPYYKIPDNIMSQVNNDIRKIFKLGDELYCPPEGVVNGINNTPNPNVPTEMLSTKLWVVGYNQTNTGVLLMDRFGNYVNACGNTGAVSFLFKIVRSGMRNITGATMASITMMKYPIKTQGDGNRVLDFDALDVSSTNASGTRIINASAVTYKDFWLPQDENGFKSYPSSTPYILQDGNVNYPFNVKANPYVLNIKGEWRANESFAHLTSRVATDTNEKNNRTEGYFKSFNPFYELSSNNSWQINSTNWTSASSITAYSPYGAELENKDALNRHSAAQFGYNFTLPTAVASNSRYSQMGFEGFEENTKINGSIKHFGFNNATISNLSTKHSHTGRKSVKTTPGQSVKLTRLTKGIYKPDQVNCSSSTPNTTCEMVVTPDGGTSQCIADLEEPYIVHRRFEVKISNATSITNIGTPFEENCDPYTDLHITSSYIIGNKIFICVALSSPDGYLGNCHLILPITTNIGEFNIDIYGGTHINGGNGSAPNINILSCQSPLINTGNQ